MTDNLALFNCGFYRLVALPSIPPSIVPLMSVCPAPELLFPLLESLLVLLDPLAQQVRETIMMIASSKPHSLCSKTTDCCFRSSYLRSLWNPKVLLPQQ